MFIPKNSLPVIMAVLAGLFIFSACSPLKTQNEVHTIADQIAGYSIPDGYREQFAVEMSGYQMVGLQGPEASCHIYLLQAPKDISVDIEVLQTQADSLEKHHKEQEHRSMRLVETRDVTVRGETVSLLVSEGLNHDNQAYREVIAQFTGRNGPALVSISSPVDQWDWDMVDSFLTSIE